MRLLIFLLFFSSNVQGADEYHRRHLMNVALGSAVKITNSNVFWLSDFSLTTSTPRIVHDSSGNLVVSNTAWVRSAYDLEGIFDVSDMYKMKSDRLTFISNFLSKQLGTIYSIGFDSGYKSEKLRIESSLFLGLAKGVKLSERNYIGLSVGRWIGGRITEKPCYDSFDRAYWCQNLTAWSDYKPSYPSAISFMDIKYLLRY